MFKYHAILNCFGNEFSVEVESDSIESAIDFLENNYEESSIVEVGDSVYWGQNQINLFNGV